MLNVRALKPITNALDGYYDDYQQAWSDLLYYETFSKLTENSPDMQGFVRNIEQGLLAHFVLDKQN